MKLNSILLGDCNKFGENTISQRLTAWAWIIKEDVREEVWFDGNLRGKGYA